MDEELRSCLNSPVADIRNVSLGGTQGAGTAVAAMFIEAFTEEKPFVHIDMAPVNWLAEKITTVHVVVSCTEVLCYIMY